ncbi:MAG: hypothetical protein ABF679_08275 [Lentilactobacillus diolivorans]|uniref:Uncharacterized protein n=2 Tax=Lentilactobacillus diolivorans TaxID=179838 RepID=A0A0R1S9M9_9LACO|nr:hypothetical protein [Lentilactobacillus diolivorans]KRL65719.1 hypothetical protein FC85_GL003066 [Lentilactobacillus diolivorans DSM 14421]MDH5105440.1 hypothetical protein [Lentilactobacillus diolivorans]GEP24361.1 hypothetical protein LDI01_19540 [Lentilactobacillus diolivorans]
MSNKLEILREYQQASSKLDQLKSQEAQIIHSDPKETKDTVVIRPQFGNEMHHLNEECMQLNMILEAMDASED